MSRKQRVAGMPPTMAWRVLAAAAGMITTMAVTRMMAALWQRSQERPVPDNPFDRRTSWKEAVTWSVALGVGTSVARVVANRTSAAAWERATGKAPPGVAR